MTEAAVAPDPDTLRRAREIAARLAVSRPRTDRTARRGAGDVASVPYRGGSDDIDLDRTLGQHVPPERLVESMLRIPARGLTNVAFPLQVARRELGRVPARDARALLLSDCVHNAGPDPRPFAARLPRLDILLDTTGEQDPELARDLARLGRGRLRQVRTHRDVAPALSDFFAS